MNLGVIVPGYVFSIALAVLLVRTADRRPALGLGLLGLVFLLAGLVNLGVALFDGRAYVDGFGPGAIGPYQGFIYGAFAAHVSVYVTVIALGQLGVAALLLLGRNDLIELGLYLAAFFLIGIAPLGVGSAFPSTVVMAAAPLLLLRQRFAESCLEVVRRRWKDGHPHDHGHAAAA